jgi:hypothetical protein
MQDSRRYHSSVVLIDKELPARSSTAGPQGSSLRLDTSFPSAAHALCDIIYAVKGLIGELEEKDIVPSTKKKADHRGRSVVLVPESHHLESWRHTTLSLHLTVP